MTTKPRRRKILRNVEFVEFSAVDVPAHEGARPAIRKSKNLITIETPQETPTMSTPDLATVTAERDALKGQVGDLTKSLADSKAFVAKVLALDTSELAFVSRLDGADQVAFVGKSASARAADIAAAEAANPVVVEYVGLDGTQFQIRKSAGEDAIGMAKQNKLLTATVMEQRTNAERVALEKRAASDLANVAGELPGKIAILKALATLPEAERTAAEAILKTANSALKVVTKTIGSGAKPADPVVGAEAASDRIDEIAKKYATEHKISVAKAYNIVTDPEHPDHSVEAVKLYADEFSGNQR